MKKPMSRVEKLYYSKRADELFHEARDLFPGYNNETAQDATDYIVERLAPRSLPQKDRDVLSEMVYSGLT
jgi:hypothetical protein